MNDATPLRIPTFQHEPLPYLTTHFRLLHITHGDFEQHVECKISTWPIEDAPPYYAISYTWGDPADTAGITLNGRPFVVRQNCEYALQQAFMTKASKYYWVDALCIDQTSTQERNHQVGMMGEIYSAAQHVFACVGPHADDSEHLEHASKRYSSLFDEISSSIRYSTISVGWDHNNPLQQKIRLGVRCLLMMGAAERLRLCKAFISYMRRPYFTRLWILQELHLAHRGSYCCGTTVQSFGHLLALNTLIEFWMTDTTFNKWIGHLGVALRALPFTRRSHAVRPTGSNFEKTHAARRCLVFVFEEPVVQDLAMVLIDIEHYECADVRDKLYGILSLVDWSRSPIPTPDYGKDNFQVAVDALSAITMCGNRFLMGSDLYCARYVLKLFTVTLSVTALRQAIEMRSGRSENPLVPRYDELVVAKSVDQWLGMKIRDHDEHRDGLEEDDTRLQRLLREQKKGFTILRRDPREPTSIFAPLDTRADDWYLSARRNRSSDTGGHITGLITRRLENGRYTLIGPALKRPNETCVSMGAIRVQEPAA
jgi:hypothetical protein